LILPFAYWFLVYACRHLLAYPKGYGDSINKCLSLFLGVPDPDDLPSGWKRHIIYRLTVVNQMSEKLSKQEGEFFNFFLPLVDYVSNLGGQRKVNILWFYLSWTHRTCVVVRSYVCVVQSLF